MTNPAETSRRYLPGVPIPGMEPPPLTDQQLGRELGIRALEPFTEQELTHMYNGMNEVINKAIAHLEENPQAQQAPGAFTVIRTGLYPTDDESVGQIPEDLSMAVFAAGASVWKQGVGGVNAEHEVEVDELPSRPFHKDERKYTYNAWLETMARYMLEGEPHARERLVALGYPHLKSPTGDAQLMTKKGNPTVFENKDWVISDIPRDHGIEADLRATLESMGFSPHHLFVVTDAAVPLYDRTALQKAARNLGASVGSEVVVLGSGTNLVICHPTLGILNTNISNFTMRSDLLTQMSVLSGRVTHPGRLGHGAGLYTTYSNQTALGLRGFNETDLAKLGEPDAIPPLLSLLARSPEEGVEAVEELLQRRLTGVEGAMLVDTAPRVLTRAGQVGGLLTALAANHGRRDKNERMVIALDGSVGKKGHMVKEIAEQTAAMLGEPDVKLVGTDTLRGAATLGLVAASQAA